MFTFRALNAFTLALVFLSLPGLGDVSQVLRTTSSRSCDFPPLHDYDGLLGLHRSLVEINSTSGGESAIGDFLKKQLSAMGMKVELQTLVPQSSAQESGKRSNLLAYPSTRQTRVLLTSHMDTVPPFLNYSIKHSDSDQIEIHGRGTNDDKAGLAAQIIALKELLADGAIKPSDASLLLVVGEETGGDGATKANDLGLDWEAVIFAEPTELKLVTAHKGSIGFNVRAHGRAAHSGYPEEGRSAISMLLPALVAIEKMEIPGSEELGPTTVNIGRISGGAAINIVPESAMAGVSIRLAGPSVEDAKQIVLETVKRADERLEVEFLPDPYPPVKCDVVPGFNTTTVNYGTDVPHIKGSHRSYLYGGGSIKTAHTDREFIYADDLAMAARGYKKLVLEALNVTEKDADL